MTCAESALLLAPHVDGELPDRDRAELAAHHAVCPACTRRAETELRFVAAVRASAIEIPAAPEVRARLLALARAHPHRAGGKARAARAFAAAGAFALAASFALVWIGSGRAREAAGWRRAFVDDHRETVLASGHLQAVTDSPRELEIWFAERMGAPLRLPALRGARLKGGRMCVLKGTRVGLAVYESAGGAVSLFVAHADGVQRAGWPGADRLAGREGECSLLGFRDGPQLCVLVSEHTPERLRQMALPARGGRTAAS